MDIDKKLVCRIILKANSNIVGEVSKEQLKNGEWILVENTRLLAGTANNFQSILHKNEIKKIIVFKRFKVKKFISYDLSSNPTLGYDSASKVEEFS